MSYSYERVEITLKREDGTILSGTINQGSNRVYINIWQGEVTIDGVFTVKEEKKDDKA